ncbi:hypothetical protein [Paenibacillus ottowii]|uniref:Uncharacterized protein n=1 Tax=Paenibacillus ottowii TaxID=2315729 RepID=A0ABY3B7E8_9BACL|nr:hypothetical protein [Paenibacillus ottowii]TQS00071.1 hypothetical protein FKV70_04625 [Paenibacillus ottowii]TQS00140.1 hypothetical protein FKV70_05000 [Paenibacillus ottowii]
MDKVILTKAQAKAIELWKEERSDIEGLVRKHVTEVWVWEEMKPLNGMPLDKLIRALYIGYEVEQTMEEKLLELYREGLPCPTTPSEDSAFREGMKKACEIAGIKVKWARN